MVSTGQRVRVTKAEIGSGVDVGDEGTVIKGLDESDGTCEIEFPQGWRHLHEDEFEVIG